MYEERSTTVELRPNDFDVGAHLNNSVCLELLEVGRWRWCEANGIDFDGRDCVNVVSRAEIDFLHPIGWRRSRSLTVFTKLKKVHRFSVFMDQRVEDSNGHVCLRAVLRLALLDKNNNRPIAINFNCLMGGDEE